MAAPWLQGFAAAAAQGVDAGEEGRDSICAVHGSHSLGGLLHGHPDGGDVERAAAGAAGDLDRLVGSLVFRLGYADDGTLAGQGLVEVGAETGTVSAIQPHIPVDHHDLGRRQLFQHGAQAGQFPSIKAARLVRQDCRDFHDSLFRRARILPHPENDPGRTRADIAVVDIQADNHGLH